MNWAGSSLYLMMSIFSPRSSSTMAGDTLALGAHAGADGVHVLVGRPDGHLGAAARLPGDGLDLHGAVVDLGDLQLEQPLHQAGMGPGNEDLGAAGGAADLHHIHLHVLALHQFLARDLLAGEQQGLGGLAAGADPQGHGAGAGVDPGHHAGEDLVLLGVELVIDHAPLGLPEALDNDLLAVAGGDAAELRVVHRDVHHVADLVPGGNGSWPPPRGSR